MSATDRGSQPNELDLTAEPLGEIGPETDLTKEPAEPLQPRAIVPYDPAELREETRTWVIKGLIYILGGTLVTLLALTALGITLDDTSVQAIFPSLTTLVGTALGFYFGGKDNTR